MRACLMAPTVKRLPTMRETRVRFLGWESPLEKEMAIHSSTLAWKIPWTEEPNRLQYMGLQRVGHDWVTSLAYYEWMNESLNNVLPLALCFYHSFSIIRKPFPASSFSYPNQLDDIISWYSNELYHITHLLPHQKTPQCLQVKIIAPSSELSSLETFGLLHSSNSSVWLFSRKMLSVYWGLFKENNTGVLYKNTAFYRERAQEVPS